MGGGEWTRGVFFYLQWTNLEQKPHLPSHVWFSQWSARLVDGEEVQEKKWLAPGMRWRKVKTTSDSQSMERDSNSRWVSHGLICTETRGGTVKMTHDSPLLCCDNVIEWCLIHNHVHVVFLLVLTFPPCYSVLMRASLIVFSQWITKSTQLCKKLDLWWCF